MKTVDATLSISDLCKWYGGSGQVPALDHISLEIPKGELLVVLGPSGCGKTTLLRCVAGLEDPSSGRISLFGRLVRDAPHGPNVPSHRRNVGMVFQNYALWPHMTAAQNVAYPLRARGTKRAPALLEASRMLELLGCGHLGDRYPSQMSGGQQQRIAVARSLVGEPETVLFDEPLSNIDEQLRREVRGELRRLHSELGFTGLYVTHDQREGIELGDHIAVLHAGRLAQFGTPGEIYDRPATAQVARFLGVENSFACRVHGGRMVLGGASLAGAWGRLVPSGVSGAEVLVRADAMRLLHEGRRDDLELDGTCQIRGGVVADVLTHGKTQEATVIVNDMRLLCHSADPAEAVREGDHVACYFRPDDAHVYPRGNIDGGSDSDADPERTASVG